MHPTTPLCTSGELPRGDRRRNRCETTLDAARSLIGSSAARREAHGHAVYGPDGMRAACDAAEKGCAHPRDMLDHARPDLDQARKSKAGRKSLDAPVLFACRLILRRLTIPMVRTRCRPRLSCAPNTCSLPARMRLLVTRLTRSLRQDDTEVLRLRFSAGASKTVCGQPTPQQLTHRSCTARHVARIAPLIHRHKLFWRQHNLEPLLSGQSCHECTSFYKN